MLMFFVQTVKRTKKAEQLAIATGDFTVSKSSQYEGCQLLDRSESGYPCFTTSEISWGFVSCCLLESSHFLTPYGYSLVTDS